MCPLVVVCRDDDPSFPLQAQTQHFGGAPLANPAYGVHPPHTNQQHESSLVGGSLYPTLDEFMGLEITADMLASHQVALFQPQAVSQLLLELVPKHLNP